MFTPLFLFGSVVLKTLARWHAVSRTWDSWSKNWKQSAILNYHVSIWQDTHPNQMHIAKLCIIMNDIEWLCCSMLHISVVYAEISQWILECLLVVVYLPMNPWLEKGHYIHIHQPAQETLPLQHLFGPIASLSQLEQSPTPFTFVN